MTTKEIKEEIKEEVKEEIKEKIQPIEKDRTTIVDTVLTNIIKMLTARKLLDENSLQDNIKKIVNSASVDLSVYKIKKENISNSSKGDAKGDAKGEILVKIIPYKIASINKTSPIMEFIHEYPDNRKFIIVKDINKKNYLYIRNSYSQVELFLEEELMINLIDHILVPQHILLSPEESSSFYEKFNCKKRDMPKIYNTDPVSKYYDFKVNDIVKILRPSELAGISVFYRLVVKGEVSK